MPMYRKKPVEIEAVQYDGTNLTAIRAWMAEHGVRTFGSDLVIHTLEGSMLALPGDWVIRGVAGEFYPCKPDIFVATYDPVDT